VRILFDQGTPAPFRSHLAPHRVSTAFELNWGQLKNGDLMSEAEKAGFDVMVTTDQNLKYQQNLSTRQIGIVVIDTTSWPRIKKGVARVVEAVNHVGPGGYVEVAIP
jgi:hypothetical protein